MRNPFTTTPVWGHRFFGREKLIDEILCGSRDTLWVVGLRRIGKTSLLKQLDYVAEKKALGYVGVYFDLEGCRNVEALKERLLAKLEISAEKFASHGVEIKGLARLDFFALLQELFKRVHRARKKLLLLCDEVEELVEIARRGELEILARLRGLLQEGDCLRTVLASTQRLKELKDFPWLTSPFLNGFEPPLYLANFSDEESMPLITQIKEIETASARKIMKTTGNHPFLTQLLCLNFWETKDLQKAIEMIEHSSMLSDTFLKEDVQHLTCDEKRILLKVIEHPPVEEAVLSKFLALPAPTVKGLLANLVNLGFLKWKSQGFVCANHLFTAWLEKLDSPLLAGSGPRISFDDVIVDFRKREVYQRGQPIRMTKKEFDILKELIERRDEVVDRFDLLGWHSDGADEKEDAEFTTRTIDMLVARIRRKLEDDPSQPRYIQSVRGIGYKFIAKVHHL